jgi:hypothetical protein
MKRYAVFILALLIALPMLGAPPCETFKYLGDATHTPNVLTTLSTAPDVGVTLPTGTVRIIVSVETQPIRFLLGSTNPTATRGNVLYAGNTLVIEDPSWPAAFKFIDTSAGASTVNVQFLGYNCASGVNQ